MPEFNIRTDAVDVEQIMRQIRARIRDKRGVDYTEEEIQELAAVKLETFLDPTGVRSDLVQQFKSLPKWKETEFPPFEFEDVRVRETHRGLLRLIRKLLSPILKLFFNPNPLVHALHQQNETLNEALRTQSQINEITQERLQNRDRLDQLQYEVTHNLVLEITRLGIEVKNLKMRVESLSSRLDFNERRARALEGVVQYRQDTDDGQPAEARRDAESESQDGGEGSARRRKRRRRGRRGRGAIPSAEDAASAGAAPTAPANPAPDGGATPPPAASPPAREPDSGAPASPSDRGPFREDPSSEDPSSSTP